MMLRIALRYAKIALAKSKALRNESDRVTMKKTRKTRTRTNKMRSGGSADEPETTALMRVVIPKATLGLWDT
jgi:hypothetical protein